MTYGGGSIGDESITWDDLEDAIQAGLQCSLSDLNFKVVKKQEWIHQNSGAGDANNVESNNNQNCDDESVDTSRPWKCATCTFVNENGSFLTCEVCNQPRI